MVASEVSVAVVETTLSFPLSEEEATNGVLKRSIEAGIAEALGLEVERVRVVSS